MRMESQTNSNLIILLTANRNKWLSVCCKSSVVPMLLCRVLPAHHPILCLSHSIPQPRVKVKAESPVLLPVLGSSLKQS